MRKHILRHILYAFLAVGCGGSFVHAAEDSRPATWTKVLSESVPLDSQESGFLQEDSSWKYNAEEFLSAVKKLPAGRDFKALYQDLSKRFESTQVTESRLFTFFANSYRLLRLIKTGQTDFAKRAFAPWLGSIYEIDFKKMSRLEFADHLLMMEMVYTHAFVRSGKWEPAEIDRLNQFMNSQKKVGPRSWGVNFSGFLRSVASEHIKDLLYGEHATINMGRALRTYAIAFPSLVALEVYIAFPYVVIPVDNFFENGLLKTLAWISTTIVTGGVSYTVSVGTGEYIANKWWTYPLQRLQRSSFLVKSRHLLKCESMLENRK